MKILVVDDEHIVARALSRAFSSKGHKVIVAHSGEEGLKSWIETAPDAVLLDVVMPGLTGPQVIEEYTKKDDSPSRAQIILMTAHSGVKGRDAARELGADEFIQKPFEDVFKLVTQVEDLVRTQKK
jgi:DNA-binding response OmpR family regulator